MINSDSRKFACSLLDIDNNMGSEDLEAFKFFCIDLIPLKKLETVESAHNIFQYLINEDILNEEDNFIVAEILYRIKSISLLTRFGYTKDAVEKDLPRRGRVSEYRQMLYDLSEGLTKEEVKAALFYLRDHIPKKLSTDSALELLINLEKQCFISETNISLLEETCRKISPELLKILAAYKERQDPYTEESGSMREYAGSLHSFAASQDLKAGNVQEPSLQQPVGQDRLKPAAEESALYKMNGPHRGYCLIFNNVHFKEPFRPRNGSQKDAVELESVFKWLGFEVKKYDDKTSAELDKLLQDWQSSECWKDSDCLVCCILSHGESGKIYGTDGGLIPINTITSFFTAKRCPLLAKKPKLFFIQACQGQKVHQPVYLEADSHEPGSPGADAQTSGFIATQQQVTSSIPEEADFLLGMATVDGYFSFRDVQHGTWFIQALCKKLWELVPRREDILSILTAVNADVSKLSDKNGQKKQMPQPAYTLRKKVIFPVPRDPPPMSKQL
ncbi:caspase-8 [Zootoca vivipara]|uniref:caspase-8 n=1 Tax=Zootoca vivipara TaxID=8524 RepID=UPI001590722B|nr:caspase-8-like [Zootoca vivipara]XP_034993102.1 caspase-8 [Zootoca vivipara]XP_060137651.1 caspase-8 [Zootoca vivipara]